MVGCRSAEPDFLTRAREDSLAKTATRKNIKPKPKAVKPTPSAMSAKLKALPRGAFVNKRSPEVENKILEVLADGWSIAKAAEKAGVSRWTACEWSRLAKIERAELDPKDADYGEKYASNFHTRWEQAMEAGVDKYEDEAGRRATGYDEPVFGKDGIVGHRTLYSDPLMMMIMKGKRPERYGVDRKEISGPNGTPIPVSVEIEFVAPQKVGKK